MPSVVCWKWKCADHQSIDLAEWMSASASLNVLSPLFAYSESLSGKASATAVSSARGTLPFSRLLTWTWPILPSPMMPTLIIHRFCYTGQCEKGRYEILLSFLASGFFPRPNLHQDRNWIYSCQDAQSCFLVRIYIVSRSMAGVVTTSSARSYYYMKKSVCFTQTKSPVLKLGTNGHLL